MPLEKVYTFYCNACGQPFPTSRCDSRTCSTICRAALSQLNRYERNIGFKEWTEQQKKEIAAKAEAVKDGGAKPETGKDGEGAAVGILKGKKKQPDPEPQPEPQPAPAPVPEPAATAKEEKKPEKSKSKKK